MTAYDPPQSAAALRAVIETRRAEQRWHTEMARAIAQEIAALELRARLAEGGKSLPAGDESVLRDDDTDDTNTGVDLRAQVKSEAVRRAAGRATRKHPAQVAFYKANKTIGDIAKEIGEGRPRVSSWMSEDDPRPIPEQHVEYFKKKYQIPRSAWKRIAS